MIIIKNKFGIHYYNDAGQLHRDDGPAIEFDSGRKDWYYHGKCIYCYDQKQFEKLIRRRLFW